MYVPFDKLGERKRYPELVEGHIKTPYLNDIGYKTWVVLDTGDVLCLFVLIMIPEFPNDRPCNIRKTVGT